MPDLIVQLVPLALTPLAALVPNGIQRCVILASGGLYFAGVVALSNLPSVRLKKLEQSIDEIVKLQAIAVQELDKNPRFVTEISLRIAQVKLSESILRTKAFSGKDIVWGEYAQHLRGLWLHFNKCHRSVTEIRLSILMALECNRRREYTQDIAQRQAIFESAFLSPVQDSFMPV
ncbi:hypothetical protein K438DRAFT_1278886 [Mycena galopus ATCC 62051]|nr:hypothetical protein K438DRAFT_1278886 [Mycena galopus ATCC 62051]